MGKRLDFFGPAAKRVAGGYVKRDFPRLVGAWQWMQAETSNLLVPERVSTDNFLWDADLALAPLPDRKAELAWVSVRGVIAEEDLDGTVAAIARLAEIDRQGGPQTLNRSALLQQVHDHTLGYRFTIDSVDYEHTREIEVMQPQELSVEVVATEIAARGLAAATDYLRAQAASQITTMKEMAHMLSTVPGLRE